MGAHTSRDYLQVTRKTSRMMHYAAGNKRCVTRHDSVAITYVELPGWAPE